MLAAALLSGCSHFPFFQPIPKLDLVLELLSIRPTLHKPHVCLISVLKHLLWFLISFILMKTDSSAHSKATCCLKKKNNHFSTELLLRIVTKVVTDAGFDITLLSFLMFFWNTLKLPQNPAPDTASLTSLTYIKLYLNVPFSWQLSETLVRATPCQTKSSGMRYIQHTYRWSGVILTASSFVRDCSGFFIFK